MLPNAYTTHRAHNTQHKHTHTHSPGFMFIHPGHVARCRLCGGCSLGLCFLTILHFYSFYYECYLCSARFCVLLNQTCHTGRDWPRAQSAGMMAAASANWGNRLCCCGGTARTHPLYGPPRFALAPPTGQSPPVPLTAPL